ncbi:hypothetical protein G6F56_000229 [Rhizopus delemar]|nr:hypothetical protein G6F56_000229 [Rhizopus delemar]
MKGLTLYEKQRQKNIELNNQLLSQLGVKSARTAIVEPSPINNKVQISTKIRKPQNKAGTKKKLIVPVRKSLRIKGEEPKEDSVDDLDIADALDEKIRNTGDRLLTAEEYFDEETQKNAIRVDGHFSSWVNPIIIQKHGIEASASEAWENNGGGKFSYADTTGSGKRRKKGMVSNAKADALKMFKKNPNQYFYRLNEPGEEQWLHDWSEEEKVLFLDIVRQHGCGDKWGLFATYIPHRVGYQCSNFYRQVVLKNGLVFDPNYMVG